MVAIPRRLAGRFTGIDHDSDTTKPAVRISWWDFHRVQSYLTSSALAAHLVPEGDERLPV